MEEFWREILDEYGISMPPNKNRNRNFDFYLGSLAVQANRRPNLPADIYIRRRLFESDLNFVIRDSLKSAHRKVNRGLSADDGDCAIAFIWDLDDITMMSRERLIEISQKHPDVDSMSLHRLFEKILMKVDIAHPDEIDAKYVTNIDDALYAEQYSPRYYVLKSLYNEISDSDEEKGSTISHALLEKCGLADEEIELCQTAKKFQEIHNQRWKNVRKSLDIVNRRSAESRDNNFANLVISKEGIVHAASQLLVSGHSGAIPIENIYSTCQPNEKSVWSTIRKRFGEQCRLVYITSSIHPILPENMRIQICPLKADECIEGIFNCQQALLK